MSKKLRCLAPIVVLPVNVSDWGTLELCVSSIGEAAKVYAIHHADRSFGSNAKAPHSAVPAKVMFVFLGIEEIFGKVCRSRRETKSFRFRDGGPKSSAFAN
jgi:hypothetical protein